MEVLEVEDLLPGERSDDAEDAEDALVEDIGAIVSPGSMGTGRYEPECVATVISDCNATMTAGENQDP